MYHRMDNEIALELIKEWIKPGNIPLGIPFGWTQPDETDNITLGDLYLAFSGEYTVKDLLFNELGYYSNYKLELAVESLECAKHVIRMARELGVKDLRNDTLTFDGIYSSDNPSIELAELEENEICLYRLSILCLNTMTDGHNLAIEYMEYLADYYVSKNSVTWGLYDGDSYEHGEIVECLTTDNHFPFNFYDNHNHYDVEKTLDPDNDVIEWINNIEADYQENYTRDLIMELFPNYDISYDYQRDEILYFIAWIVSWLKSEFHSGNLSFPGNDIEGLSKKLQDWIFYINNQLTLPLENAENEN